MAVSAVLKIPLFQLLEFDALHKHSVGVLLEEGCCECYSKYIKQNCFIFFLSMKWTNRCHLAMVALIAR